MHRSPEVVAPPPAPVIEEPPTPKVEVIVDGKKPAPVVEERVEAAPPVGVEAAPPVQPPTPTEPKPIKKAKPGPPTEAQLQEKLAKLESSLMAREAKTGQRDSVLHQFLDQARQLVQQASTDPERLKAARFLSDFEKQLAATR